MIPGQEKWNDMKASKLSDAQILAILKQGENDVAAANLYLRRGVRSAIRQN